MKGISKPQTSLSRQIIEMQYLYDGFLIELEAST